MERRGQARDRQGRVWTASVLEQGEAVAEDLRFWREEMTPDERVAAVEACLASALAASGVDEPPNAHRVRYLLVCAHAVAHHARPRATKNLDVYVEPTSESAGRVLAAIRDFFGGADLGA